MSDENQDVEEILKRAQSGEIFISSVGFAEEGIELAYIELSKQSERIYTAQTIFITADTVDTALFYAEFQDACAILIREAFVELRS